MQAPRGSPTVASWALRLTPHFGGDTPTEALEGQRVSGKASSFFIEKQSRSIAHPLKRWVWSRFCTSLPQSPVLRSCLRFLNWFRIAEPSRVGFGRSYSVSGTAPQASRGHRTVLSSTGKFVAPAAFLFRDHTQRQLGEVCRRDSRTQARPRTRHRRCAERNCAGRRLNEVIGGDCPDLLMLHADGARRFPFSRVRRVRRLDSSDPPSSG